MYEVSISLKRRLKIAKSYRCFANVKRLCERILENLSNRQRDDFIYLDVTFDGTWQKRRFSSNMETAAVIEVNTGYVVDYLTLCRYCQFCVTKKALVRKKEHDKRTV